MNVNSTFNSAAIVAYYNSTETKAKPAASDTDQTASKSKNDDLSLIHI